MSSSSFNRATHFSIVWAVTLSIITLVEWHSLDRNPLGQDIYSPFISRTVAIKVGGAEQQPELQFAGDPVSMDSANKDLQYEVEIKFNGPFFLAVFFIPVLLFHGIGLLIARLRKS